MVMIRVKTVTFVGLFVTSMLCVMISYTLLMDRDPIIDSTDDQILWGSRVTPRFIIQSAYNTSSSENSWLIENQLTNSLKGTVYIDAEYNPNRIDILNGIEVTIVFSYFAIINNITIYHNMIYDSFTFYAENFTRLFASTMRTYTFPLNFSANSDDTIFYRVSYIIHSSSYKSNALYQETNTTDMFLVILRPAQFNTTVYTSVISIARVGGSLVASISGLGVITNTKKKDDDIMCDLEDCDPLTQVCDCR